jgi:hypothetical protein
LLQSPHIGENLSAGAVKGNGNGVIGFHMTIDGAGERWRLDDGKEVAGLVETPFRFL